MTSLKKQEVLKLLKMNYEGKVTFISIQAFWSIFSFDSFEVSFMDDSYIHSREPSLSRMFKFMEN